MLRKSVQGNRSEAAAREGERFLSSVFSSIQDGISVLDKDLNIIRVNQTMEDWYSHKVPLVGKKCYDAYHGRQAQCDSCPSIRTIESGKSAHEVVPKAGPKGEIIGWLDLYSFPLRDSRTGELSGVIEYVRDITDRRKAEVELHGALERYKELQGIIDKSSVIMVIWRPGPGSPVSFISDSVAQWGYRRDEFVSTLVYDDIIHKEDLESEKEEFRDFVRKGANDFVQEYRIVTKSGEVRFVEDHTYVRRDSDGNPVLYEGIVIDVTTRKIAQQKSEELTSGLLAIVEAFPDLYFRVDAHGTILDFNAGRIADLYVPPQKFLGRKMQEVLPPDVGKMYGGAFDEVLKTGRTVAREYPLEVEGEDRFFEARIAPVANGQILIVVRNITTRKRAEEALRVSESEYRQLADSITDVFFALDKDMRYTYWNKASEVLSGIPARDALGKSLTELFPGPQGEKARKVYLEVLGTKKAANFPNEYNLGGKKYLFDVTAYPIEDGVSVITKDITERSRAEDALRERDIQFKKLSFNVPGMIYQFMKRLDGTYCVPFTTEAIKGIFGCSPEDVRDDFSPIAKAILPEDLDRLLRSIEYSAEHLTLWQCEYRVQIPGQPVRWVSGQSTPEKLADGSIVWHGFNTDITERKRIEEALASSEQFLGNVIEQSPVSQWISDSEGTLMKMNQACRELFGITDEEAVGKYNLLKDNLIEAQGFMALVGDVFEKGESARFTIDYDVRRVEHIEVKGATHRILDVVVSPIKDIHGKITNALVEHMDITERMRAEEMMRTSEEKYRQLVDLAQEGILMTDADAVFRFVNPKMADMLGYHVDEMVGKPLFQFMNEQAAELARRKFEDRRRGLTGRYELDFLRKDGTLLRTSIGVTPVKDKDGDFSGSLAVVADITDRKRYEEALEIANQKLRLLGQVTRHDALNQLAVLMGWLQIAQESVIEPPVQEYLKNMRTAAETVTRQLDFTGDYQKMGVAKPEWIDVKTAFLNGAAGFSPSKLAKSVHVDGLEVYADMMFEKIFHNLIDNSIRHGKKATEIRVHYKKKGNGVSLVYEDDGVGIPVDEKGRLFLRGSGTHSGFGLFMVRSILGITGITIEENGIPGHGVRFEMHVPSNGFRVREGAESQKR
jgi:PAS domain S-box-containing protein